MSTSAATSAALAPPPGEESNFVDPPSIQPAIIAGLTVCLFVSTLSVLLRCWAQRSLSKKLIWADFWMLLGWAFQVVFVGFLYACLPYGGGYHLWDVTKSNYDRIKFLLFVDYILYGCAILGPKISILLQLVAIFVPPGRGLGTSARWFYWAALFLMAMNLIFYVAHNFVLIFQCNPVAKGWDSSIPGVCLDQVALLESSGPFNIISDLLIFLLPLSSIWQLKLPLKTRLGIGSAFAIGLFGCICSAVRLYYSNKLNSSGDATYLVFQNQLWANTEITISVLIANVIILPRFIRSKRRTGSNYDYAHKTSSRNHRTTKFTQRHPSSDPYIELTEGDSNTARREDASYDDEHKTGRGTVQGIMRTIQIDTIEEKVYAPKSTATNNFQVDVVTEVTSSGTRT